jgi:hypothetical protein
MLRQLSFMNCQHNARIKPDRRVLIIFTDHDTVYFANACRVLR